AFHLTVLALFAVLLVLVLQLVAQNGVAGVRPNALAAAGSWERHFRGVVGMLVGLPNDGLHLVVIDRRDRRGVLIAAGNQREQAQGQLGLELADDLIAQVAHFDDAAIDVQGELIPGGHWRQRLRRGGSDQCRDRRLARFLYEQRGVLLLLHRGGSSLLLEGLQASHVLLGDRVGGI